MLYICLFCDMLIYGHNYPIHEISFARRVWVYSALRLCVMSHWWGLSHCGYVLRPIVIILSLWCKTKWCVYEFFHQYHVPLRHGIVGTRKSSPRTFIGQWVVEHIPHYVLWGMVVCLFVGIVFYLLAYIIIIQSGGGKSNKKMSFNIF